MTSEKEVTLKNVLYVLEIRNNLVYGSFLSSHGCEMVFESDKFFFARVECTLGKGI